MPEIPFIPPVASPTELAVNRLNTVAFIAANPALIVLIPRDRLVSGSGVTWVELPSRPPQVGRLIDTNAVGGLATGMLTTQDGRQDKMGFQLLLPWNGVVESDDIFTLFGFRHEIVEILPFNNYEVRASVVRYG